MAGAKAAYGGSPILAPRRLNELSPAAYYWGREADLRMNRRIEEPSGDREALEHIARALEGRTIPGPAQGVSRTQRGPELALTPQSLNILLEAMQAAVGILAAGTLTHANSAFAFAFGYPSTAELIEAGGLGAILAEGTVLTHEGSERSAPLDALTRSRRRVKVAFDVRVLDAEQDIKLLRLIDQASLDHDAETMPASSAAPASSEPEPVSPEPALVPRLEPNAASGRLDFLAKVSHEVRTPLNSIIGFAELMLQERFGQIGSERYKGYVEDIHHSGLYALSLLNDLLDISKIEAGKFELNFTAVEVPEIVEDCAASLQPLAKRARILLRTSLAPDLPTVVADPRRLKQILLNLLTNAIKFTKEGGQVIVSGTMIAGELRVRVRDNGVGMTKDEIAFAMQPFHQLDTAPRKQTGTGLGLPVTKALVDANRARLVLTSEPGIGTSADVIFPAERLFTSSAAV
ncbi:MAG: HAMP domain-containing histidine kinase [Methyloceanibacter sp.]|nr:HAMP domain-containing histidine kinase [Methyloceanibacter sp.]